MPKINIVLQYFTSPQQPLNQHGYKQNQLPEQHVLCIPQNIFDVHMHVDYLEDVQLPACHRDVLQ